MKTALCLGGAASLFEDIDAARSLGEYDYVVACNDAITVWPGKLDVAVTLHPEKMPIWRDERRENGFPDPERFIVFGNNIPSWMEMREFRFPGQDNSGSSGLFTAKVAIIDLGADRVVLAGVPLERAPHFFDRHKWEAAVGYRTAWEQLRPEYRRRMRSMSGWTAHFLGTPTREWLETGAETHDIPKPPVEIPVMSTITIGKVVYLQHPVPFEVKREWNVKGFRVMDIAFAPADAVAEAETKSEEAAGDGYPSDDELRAAIEAATGKAPHHKTGRAKLIEQYEAIRKARQEETASNGLTRREIEADLQGENIDFDPAESVENLLALRDQVRAARGKA